MADTELGEALTESHKRAQTRLRVATVRDLLRVWPALDPARLDATWDGWYEAVAAAVRARYAQSAELAATYLTAFKAAETGVMGEPILVGMLPPKQLEISARVTGPIAIKKLTAAGYSPTDASIRAFTLHSGAGSRLALQGGRTTIKESIAKDTDALGYKRVTGGSACSFCQMLAGRGAVYKEDTVEFQTHDHCACSAEPVYRKK